MLRVIFVIVRLYILIGVVLGLILVGSAIYHYVVATGPTPPLVEVLGNALLAGAMRVVLWGPEFWQFGRTQPLLEWILLPRRTS